MKQLAKSLDAGKPGIMDFLLCYFSYKNQHPLCEIVFQIY